MADVIDIRNLIVSGLTRHLGRPVILSDQVAPREGYPFVYYTLLTSYIPQATLGNYTREPAPDGGVIVTRSEQPTMTLSLTACSINRDDGGAWISGEDEAIRLATAARAWFVHIARAELSAQGIVVVDVQNVQSRSAIIVEDIERRWGFDVRLRYSEALSRRDETIQDITIKEASK